jgi:hypothetical protein
VNFELIVLFYARDFLQISLKFNVIEAYVSIRLTGVDLLEIEFELLLSSDPFKKYFIDSITAWLSYKDLVPIAHDYFLETLYREFVVSFSTERSYRRISSILFHDDRVPSVRVFIYLSDHSTLRELITVHFAPVWFGGQESTILTN